VASPLTGGQLLLLYVFKGLAWLLLLTTSVSISSSKAHAARQESVGKRSPNNKVPAAPARKSGIKQARTVLLKQPSPPPIDLLERRYLVTYRVRTGDKLPDVLNRVSLSPAERQFWIRAIKRDIGVRVLPAGKEVHFYFAKPLMRSRVQTGPRPLKALEVDYNDSSTLTWEKGIRGILFQQREKPYDVELKTAGAVVDESLFEDGRKAGIHPALLSQLMDIFTWDIDLEKDIRKGDSFKMLYEQRTRKGQESRPSLRIVAAELVNAGQKFTAIYFEKQKGQGNYYNPEGRSLARAFLRFPLEFTSISSQFAHSRFHPLLRVNLPHTGVDFAAERGTPVRAVGDGVINQAGWNGSYGKAIDIQHDSTYMSRYAHLDRFAEGIHNGSSVLKGQVIGYVGSTGRSTGPHLHFELYKDQQYVNPLSVDFPADESIDPALEKLFDSQKQIYLVELSSVPQS
jgi:murein DD-endopeptidase MepM/ murein hydrolase activator NlpD